MRRLLFGSLLWLACESTPAGLPPPEVVIMVPPEPIAEPDFFPREDAGVPQIIGHFRGVPIPEQGPWTGTLPRPDGTFSAAPERVLQRGAVRFRTGPGTLRGVCALTVANQPTGSPRVRVEVEVRSGRVRVFLKYLGDIYRTLDGPGSAAFAEGHEPEMTG